MTKEEEEHLQEAYSKWKAAMDLPDYLIKERLYGVETRLSRMRSIVVLLANECIQRCWADSAKPHTDELKRLLKILEGEK